MAAAQVVREARALEEAIATGMVRSKGTGKKKKALKCKSSEFVLLLSWGLPRLQQGKVVASKAELFQ